MLVHINFQYAEFNEEYGEFTELVRAAGLQLAATIKGRREKPDPCCFIGNGKIKEISSCVANTNAEIIVFNHTLSPTQERNIEKACCCRVIDRVGLILDIFAQRARSFEGKLQVELAQLQRLSSRLVRGWTHLERQKGGIGLRGPGESQLETDQRLIGKRIKVINARLQKVSSQRQQSRKQRNRSNTRVISLIGYANAGKSTLFNRLTGANVYAMDKLFATLDPTFRRMELPSGATAILTDTVGFIRHLPPYLVKAFHATLEEMCSADLLLHVIDASCDQKHTHIEQVNEIITDIGAGTIPQIEVHNKIDRIEDISTHSVQDANGLRKQVWLSASSGVGINELKYAIEHFFHRKTQYHQLFVPASAGKLRARLFSIGIVQKDRYTEKGGWIMEVSIDKNKLKQICKKSELDLS